MNMVERLVTFLKAAGIKIVEFERELGLARGNIYKMNTLSSNVLNKISCIYPNLNINWIETGKGKMMHPRIVDRMEEYILSKGQTVEEVGKLVWANDIIEELLIGRRKKDTLFSYFREHPCKDIGLRGVDFFIAKYATDINRTWLLTGQGTMLVDNTCKNCKKQAEEIKNLTKYIGVLEYRLEQFENQQKNKTKAVNK